MLQSCLVILPPNGMGFNVGILHVIINGHGSNANMNKRSQSGVLDLNVLGSVAVPNPAPS